MLARAAMFARNIKSIAIGIVLLCPGLGYSAEVTGSVAVDHKGLFDAGGRSQSHPISVALIPAESQVVKARPQQVKRIEIVENRMTPAFLTVQVGDRLEFVNRDAVFHQVFSLSENEAISVQLGQAGSAVTERTLVDLATQGTKHFFCRIHNKSYARVDVVNSPYLQTIRAGQTFSFSGLALGHWNLRVASPAAETQVIKVRALTAPPPLSVTLTSHNGGDGGGRLRLQSGIEQLYQK